MDLPVHDPKKRKFLKNGEVWGKFGGVWSNNDKGRWGQIVMKGCQANEDVLCKRWSSERLLWLRYWHFFKTACFWVALG